jgi:hypothetical protein
MTDSCWFGIEVKNEDMDELKKKFSPLKDYEADDVNGDEDSTEFFFYEANYAFYSELEDLKTKGINFKGSHGAGSEYGSMKFVSYNNKYLEIDINSDGEIMLPVSGITGEVNEAQLAKSRDYTENYKNIIKYFKSGGVASIW